MKRKFKPKEANDYYNQLPHYSEVRFNEISEMAEPYVKITDRYGRLVSRITYLLGEIAPKDTQDLVVRDLMSDVFDFLYESRTLILSSKLTVSFPLARRAYESLSLLHLCCLDKAWAEKWEGGKKIGNAEIRRELGKHPMGESEQQTKELYNFFCSATHPNRELIPYRYLGQGNKFVLGVIGRPELVMVVDYCIKNLEMWFWLTATITYFFREIIAGHDRSYFDAYSQAAKEAQKVKQQLVENYNHLLTERRHELKDTPAL